ncbi:MAG: Lrp/AsnC family transcriptional regulator [Candidatus Bathyarchaeia archaeon]
MKIKGRSAVLDDLDWGILELLQENAKQTYTEIGHRLGVAHSTIYERIKRMEEYGVIEKYGAFVDLGKVGIKPITAIVTVYTDPKESEKIAEKLAKFHEVLEAFSSFSEELVIIAKVIARDQTQLHSFIAESIAPLPGVLRIRTSIITKKYKEEVFRTSLSHNPWRKSGRRS